MSEVRRLGCGVGAPLLALEKTDAEHDSDSSPLTAGIAHEVYISAMTNHRATISLRLRRSEIVAPLDYDKIGLR